jgi:hypothetical protein
MISIMVSPYEEELDECLNSQNVLEEKLDAERKRKNALFAKMESFYTDRLKESYFKSGENGKIGQISYVYAKEGKFFIHLYFLEITANSKLIKKYTNIELFGKEMEKLKELTEAEYKGEFFAYVDKRIRMVEDRRKVENENTVTL